MTEEEGTYQTISIEDELPALPELEPIEVVYSEPLPEAGGVAWIDLYGVRYIEVEGKQLRKVFKISMTCRASTPIAALDGLKQAIDHAEKQYKLLPYQ